VLKSALDLKFINKTPTIVIEKTIIAISPNSGTTVKIITSPFDPVQLISLSGVPIPLIDIEIVTGSSEFRGLVFIVDRPFSE
jgi:hypothetical protein